MFSESSFRDGDIFALYHGFDLGSPMFGRVDSSVPEILHVSKNVAADCLKAICRKLFPADNLRQSMASSLLLMIKHVSNKNVCC
ncbi:hypothetical protein L1987_30113 [Smallanthus sonchifolius]|uniref:Uncharacterized protein n=1 Tax=Smallanthus sonchifolius TaxID=185202 RepID=A0ACB9I347_9ASTR|nr:hypothetical protein L1987_30113 [Smallanthus sonchifolius]